MSEAKCGLPLRIYTAGHRDICCRAPSHSTGCGGSSGSQSSSPSQGSGSGGVGSPSPAFTGINIDYAPESRCSDDNWSTSTPVACNPQLSFVSCTPNSLSSCAANCQACFTSDLQTISSLKVGAITIYQPNYYALKAADAAGVKVVLGLYDDNVPGLAGTCTASGSTECTYGGAPVPLFRHRLRECAVQRSMRQSDAVGAGNLLRVERKQSQRDLCGRTQFIGRRISAGRNHRRHSAGQRNRRHAAGREHHHGRAKPAVRAQCRRLQFDQGDRLAHRRPGRRHHRILQQRHSTHRRGLHCRSRLLLGRLLRRRGQLAARLAYRQQSRANLLDTGDECLRHRPNVMRRSQYLPG